MESGSTSGSYVGIEEELIEEDESGTSSSSTIRRGDESN